MVKIQRDKKGRFIEGMEAWNKGIKTDREKFPTMGHFDKHSEKSKKKNRDAHLGKPSWNKGIPHTKKHKENLSKAWDYNKHLGGIKNLRKLAKKNTSIELKIQKFLSLLHIEYFTHKYISEITHSYQCDILIPKQKEINQKIIIECDGCYWHGCKICYNKFHKNLGKQEKNDNIRTKELIDKGFKVLRLWEHEIKVMELNDFKGVLNG